MSVDQGRPARRADGCPFCAIVAGELPATVVHETERVLAFRDLGPVAPTHLLVVPRDHHADVDALVAADPGLAGELLEVAVHAARADGLDDGHRLVVNTGADGGQTVHHLHVHVLGGRRLGWPPG